MAKKKKKMNFFSDEAEEISEVESSDHSDETVARNFEQEIEVKTEIEDMKNHPKFAKFKKGNK